MKKCSLYFIIFIIIVIIALSGWFSINGDFEKEEASKSEFNIIDTAGSLSEALQKAKTSDKPVSYTHLDVYKRQFQVFLLHIR